jgi:ABC-type Fe3+ transport system permease subunit
VFDLDTQFFLALARSLAQAALAGGVSLAIGWPAGVAAGLWEFPARRALILITTLPLLLPSFLIAIGLSLLWRGLDGLAAAVWAFACFGVPLVFITTLAAMRAVTHGQADAARLAGGERLLFHLSLRGTRPVAALASVLAAVLTLADVGPGQIFGWHGAASELLISFAARYDRVLATHQALAITIVAAAVTWPLVWRLAPLLMTSLLGRDTTPLTRHRMTSVCPALAAVVFVFVICPMAGLLRPLVGHEWPLARAWSEVTRTTGSTVLYASLAAMLSVSLGFAVAALARRRRHLQQLVVTVALALFSLPPVIIALWLLPLSSRFTVGVALALRCLPIALLFGLRAFGVMPQSWNDAAKVHRVPRATIIARVFVPWLARWAVPAGLLAALLATAEVGIVLMLHPPGHGTLPLAIFTIMANAPEALVATLCLLYVCLAALFGAALTHRGSFP